MEDHPSAGPPEAAGTEEDAPSASPAEEEAFRALRRLLLGREQAELERLASALEEQRRAVMAQAARLDDPEVRARETAEVLAEAVARARRDDRFGPALAPVVEEAMQASIRRNPRALADAISPIMGPAIRRSILQAIQGMVQSFNRAMEHSLSPRGLRWRMEAWRSGRSFGEVVALHTLAYQVEQVFLVHRETGLLLAHRSVGRAADADLVGSMLVAIRDFVQDSFEGGAGGGTLDTVQVGDRTLWVESGRDAVLAALIRGAAPEDLRLVLRSTLEQVELTFAEELGDFEGDSEALAGARPYLSECLVSQARDEAGEERRSRGRRGPAFVAAALAAGVVLVGGGLAWRSAARWGRFVRALDAEPGIVVTDVTRRDGRRVVAGLRDPLAADPLQALASAGIDSTGVTLALEPYVSLDPEMVVERARRVLVPPAGVTLAYEGGVLMATGAPDAAWIRDAAAEAVRLPGVDRFEWSGEDPAVVALRTLGRDLSDVRFRFPAGSAVVGGGPELERVRALVDEAARIARASGRTVRIRVTGSADADTGSPGLNRRLAEQRARAVIEAVGGARPPALEFEVGADVRTGAADEVRIVTLELEVSG